MQSRNPNFAFGLNFNFSRNNLFTNEAYNLEKIIPPVLGNFLLLDGTDFLLLDGTDFLLL